MSTDIHKTDSSMSEKYIRLVNRLYCHKKFCPLWEKTWCLEQRAQNHKAEIPSEFIKPSSTLRQVCKQRYTGVYLAHQEIIKETRRLQENRAWKTLRIPSKMTSQDLRVGRSGKSRTATNLSSFTHFSGSGSPFASLRLSFSFTPLGTLFFPLHSPHVLLHATVHHLEGSFDARGPSYLLTCGALLSHNIGHLPLLLPEASLLVDTK